MARPPEGRSSRASVRPPRSSSIRPRATGCGCSWTRGPGSDGTSPRADATPGADRNPGASGEPRADGTPRVRGGRPLSEEVELKLAVLYPAAIRALVLDPATSLPGVTPIGGARTVEIEDRYLDTVGGALRAAGLVARIRRGQGGRRLTVKSLARRGQGAVHRRLELEGDAGELDVDDDGERGERGDPRTWPPSPARDRVLEVVGRQPLAALVTLRQRRLQRDVAAGQSVIEMSLDEVEVTGRDGRHDRWTELECELRSGSETDLAALGELLVSRPDLAPATMSKLERALAALGDVFTQR
ncbi:MAG: hypothetical protein C0498_00465 [Anaerolinea sp.]|nr:hypothetical protein [Anaerolinea sp.]